MSYHKDHLEYEQITLEELLDEINRERAIVKSKFMRSFTDEQDSFIIFAGDKKTPWAIMKRVWEKHWGIIGWKTIKTRYEILKGGGHVGKKENNR